MPLLHASDLDWKGCRQLLEDQDTLVTVIMCIAITQLGPEMWDWDALAIYPALEEAFDVKLSVETESKLQAGMLCSKTDGFFQDPEICHATTTTFCHGDPGVDLLEESASLAELLWAHYEATLLYGESNMSGSVETLFKQAFAREDSESLANVGTYLADQFGLLQSQLQQIGATSADIVGLPPVPGMTDKEDLTVSEA